MGKKVSFRPRTGPELPQNGKNPTLFETNRFLSEFSILFLVISKSFGFLPFWGNSVPVSGRKLTFLCPLHFYLNALCTFLFANVLFHGDPEPWTCWTIFNSDYTFKISYTLIPLVIVQDRNLCRAILKPWYCNLFCLRQDKILDLEKSKGHFTEMWKK